MPSKEPENWQVEYSFMAFNYGWRIETNKIQTCRAMLLLDGQWNLQELKQKINRQYSEDKLLAMFVYTVVNADKKYMKIDQI